LLNKDQQLTWAVPLDKVAQVDVPVHLDAVIAEQLNFGKNRNF
jgi:hypothetical protein